MKLSHFDPDSVGIKGTMFGFPYTESEADLIILPVPCEVTNSYQTGTAKGPEAVLAASSQLDFSIYGVIEPWKLKTFMRPMDEDQAVEYTELRKRAREHIKSLEEGDQGVKSSLTHVNEILELKLAEMSASCSTILSKGQFCAILGGDHSSGLALMKALSEHHSFGVLQIDAHMDLRESYQGFKYSHASIMHNAVQLDGVESITQVGIRDYSVGEVDFIKNCSKSIHTFYDDEISGTLNEGKLWLNWVDEIIETLPPKVYISFDIDGLQPSLCPNTGTPVPGGLSFDQIVYLINKLATSGKEIIGFDLCEVGNDDWDGNVGARILFRLAVALGISKNIIQTE